MAQRHIRRGPWSQPLGDLVSAAIHPALAKQGFGESGLILHWEEIVGARIAAASEPIKLQWPPRPPKAAPDRAPQPATLILRVDSGFALDLQHLAPLVIERVNAHFGWACVARLSFRQGPSQRAPKRPPPKPASPQALERARALAAPVVDEALREALARLGARALDTSA